MDSNGNIAARLRRFFLRVGSARMGRAATALDEVQRQSLRNHEHLEDQAAIQPTKGEIRRAIAELRSFSDTQLDDIGIVRSDIERVVAKGRFEVARPQKAA